MWKLLTVTASSENDVQHEKTPNNITADTFYCEYSGLHLTLRQQQWIWKNKKREQIFQLKGTYSDHPLPGMPPSTSGLSMMSKCLLNMLEASTTSRASLSSVWPPGKEMLPNVQSEPPLVPFWAIPMCPVSGSQGEGIRTSFCTSSVRELQRTSRLTVEPDLSPKDLSTPPPSLVSSANLPVIYSTLASRSVINTLDRTGPGTEPWATLLVTRCQPDRAPVTVNPLSSALQPLLHPAHHEPVNPAAGQLV